MHNNNNDINRTQKNSIDIRRISLFDLCDISQLECQSVHILFFSSSIHFDWGEGGGSDIHGDRDMLWQSADMSGKSNLFYVVCHRKCVIFCWRACWHHLLSLFIVFSLLYCIFYMCIHAICVTMNTQSLPVCRFDWWLFNGQFLLFIVRIIDHIIASSFHQLLILSGQF